MTNLDRLTHEASHLSPAEQLELIARLWDNLPEDAYAGLSPAWQAEIAQRLAEYESGGVPTIPWEVIRDAAKHRLESRS